MTSSRLTRAMLASAALGIAAAPAGAIVGPSRDGGELASHVLMVLQRRGASAGFCTGIVIGPKSVLTAAHCVPPGADLRIHFRDGKGVPVRLAVVAVARHPGYRADAIARREKSIDLAVLTLAEPLPASFHSAEIGEPGPVASGTPFRVAGFGLTREGEAASSGHLRESALAARMPLSAVLLWADDPQDHGAGACTGDSGGPVRLGSVDVIVAMTLWSAGVGARRCGMLTQALWLAPYRDWIRSVTR